LGGQFKRKFFTGLMIGLVVFGVFGGGLNKNRCFDINIANADVNDSLNNAADKFTNFVNRIVKPSAVLTPTQSYWLGAQSSSLAPMYDDDENEGIEFGALLLKYAAKFLELTVSNKLYDEVFFSPTARLGLTATWTIVRDFVNLFYLLVLVFLALSTILQINKFSDKKLFLKVLVSAILVNFSLPITVAVIDASNIIMDFFAGAIQTVNLKQSLANIVLDAGGYQNVFDGHFMLEKGVDIVEFIIQVVIAVMFLYLGISLLVRLVAYWVLIVLSPLAFFSIALPGSNGFQEWKDKLLNYSFYGPLMLMYIFIAVVLMKFLKASIEQTLSGGGDMKFVTFLVAYITVLYLLYYGHDKAKQMASKAGDTVTKVIDKGGKFAVTAGKGAALATGVGAAGYLGYKWGKAQYTGVRSRINEGKWTRLATEEGRKEVQEEKEHKAKMFWASSGKKDRLEMELIEKTKSKLKDKVDLDNRTQVLDLLKNGTHDEKLVAAQIAAKKGWLDGDNLQKALSVAKNNKLLRQTIEAGAGDKNKVSWSDYNVNKLTQNNQVSEAMRNKMKSLLEIYADKRNDQDLLNKLSDEDNPIKDQELVSHIKTIFGNDFQRASDYALFAGTNGVNDLTKILNERMSSDVRQRIANNFARYMKDDTFGGDRFRSARNLDVIKASVHPFVNTALRQAGVYNLNNQNNNGQNILSRDIPPHP